MLSSCCTDSVCVHTRRRCQTKQGRRSLKGLLCVERWHTFAMLSWCCLSHATLEIVASNLHGRHQVISMPSVQANVAVLSDMNHMEYDWLQLFRRCMCHRHTHNEVRADEGSVTTCLATCQSVQVVYAATVCPPYFASDALNTL